MLKSDLRGIETKEKGTVAHPRQMLKSDLRGIETIPYIYRRVLLRRVKIRP